jgi:hypothetical protein
MKQREAQVPAGGKGRIKDALERLVQFYPDWGQPAKAAGWQKKLDALNAAVSPPAQK